MHLLTTPLIFRLLTYNATPERTRTVGIILSILFTILMVTHMVMDEFHLHATAFGVSVYIIGSRGFKLSKQVPEPHTRALLRNASTFSYCGFSRASPLARQPNIDLFSILVVSFVTGYALWLIDEFACQHLIQARYQIGLPLAFLLELHGW